MIDGNTPCPECSKTHHRPRSAFCCAAHQKAWNRRQLSEGVRIIAYAKAAMLGRGGGNTPGNPVSRVAMREMTQIIRHLNEQDKAAGRMDAISYAELLMADGSRWFDRQRS